MEHGEKEKNMSLAVILAPDAATIDEGGIQ